MVGAEGAELRRGLGLAAQAPVQTLYRCCQTWSFKPASNLSLQLSSDHHTGQPLTPPSP